MPIRFDSWEVRGGRSISVNKVSRLVLKMFLHKEEFEAEHNAYLLLENHHVPYVPRLFGHFKHQYTDLDAILLEYVGEPVDGGLTQQDWCVCLNIQTEAFSMTPVQGTLE